MAAADGLSASQDAALGGALATLAGIDSEGGSGDIGGGGGGAGSDDDSDGGISPGHSSAGSGTDDDVIGISDGDEGASDPGGGVDAGVDAGAGFPFLFDGGYVPAAAAVNATAADPAAANAAADVRDVVTQRNRRRRCCLRTGWRPRRRSS